MDCCQAMHQICSASPDCETHYTWNPMISSMADEHHSRDACDYDTHGRSLCPARRPFCKAGLAIEANRHVFPMTYVAMPARESVTLTGSSGQFHD